MCAHACLTLRPPALSSSSVTGSPPPESLPAAAGFAEACLQLTEADTAEQPGGRCYMTCSLQKLASWVAMGQEHRKLSGFP